MLYDDDDDDDVMS